MQIDPVVALTEKLAQAERALREARLRSDDKMVARWIELISLLNEELYSIVPTSTLGAGELLRRAATTLGGRQTTISAKLADIAERFSNGSRTLPDIVWLRWLRPALTRGICGNDGMIVAPLISLAIKGASRPVVVFRAVLPPPDDGDLRALSWPP
ncbi:MAG TPA: hypothetical protein VMU08_00585 [Rhizomicrobium sp.]|nr:hypothetical protein [Rhizomicrobium sp.]